MLADMYEPYYEEQAPSRIVQMITDNPKLAVGLGVFFLWSAVVFVNAGFLQSNTHPAPIASTRVEPAAQTNVASVQETQAEQQGFVLAKSDPLVEELQTALASKNFYKSGVDGQMGEDTRKAIIAYQTAAGMAVDGKVSGKLLAHIRMSAVSNQTTGSVASTLSGEANSTATSRELLRQIQTGLRNYGHSELVVDGVFGAKTRDAISAFQREQNFAVTGQPSPELLKNLIEIGAL